MKENNSDTKKPIKKIPGKKIVAKPPKFNIMWLYAVIILGLFVVQYIFSSNNAKTISYQKFETEMLKTGDV
jgi:cell division protease FtsH